MYNLNDAAQLSTVIQGAVVTVSLILIVIESKRSNRLVYASNVHSFSTMTLSFNKMLIQDVELLRIWYSYGADTLTQSEKMRYREMLMQWLMLHENIFYQYKRKFIDEETFKSWEYDLRITVGKHNLEIFEDDIEVIFPNKFGCKIAALSKMGT
jgi:hypothetical protein